MKFVDIEDESSWSENFDVTIEIGAREYWSVLENMFKGKFEMDNVYLVIDFIYFWIILVCVWNCKWVLLLDNCIIFMDRLREVWDVFFYLLFVCVEVLIKDEYLNDGLVSENKLFVGVVIEFFVEFGLFNEDAFRVE